MIIAHVVIANRRTLGLRFAPAGAEPDQSLNHYGVSAKQWLGPQMMIECGHGTLLVPTRDIVWDTGDNEFKTPTGATAPVLFASDNAIKTLRDRGAIDAAMADALRETQNEDRIASPKLSLPDSQKLLQATIRGATLTPFSDSNPLSRLFGSGTTQTVAGFQLLLPDSPHRHLLGVDAAGLPILDDAARQDLDRFLGKSGVTP